MAREQGGPPVARTTDSGSVGSAGKAGATVHQFPEDTGHETVDPDGLTPRQRRVLEVIRDWVERRGYPPSVREIGEAVGLTSTSSVAHQLRALERKGYLRRDPNRPRAVGVLSPDADVEAAEAAARPKPTYVPVVG